MKWVLAGMLVISIVGCGTVTPHGGDDDGRNTNKIATDGGFAGLDRDGPEVNNAESGTLPSDGANVESGFTDVSVNDAQSDSGGDRMVPEGSEAGIVCAHPKIDSTFCCPREWTVFMCDEHLCRHPKAIPAFCCPGVWTVEMCDGAKAN